MKRRTTVKTVEYVCEQCGEKDHVKLFDHEQMPSVINCWSCHSGMKLDVAGSLQTRRGMFPVIPEEGRNVPAEDLSISV
jgi:hypothetical protein